MSNAENRKGYRLPTDAEWEFSCRAGTSTGYCFGTPWELLEKYGWYNKNSPNTTQPVGSLKPNDLGLFDLHGNIWEWCQDTFKEPGRDKTSNVMNMSTAIANKDPRILRGGAFVNLPAYVRSATRIRYAPSDRDSLGGFRPSRTYP